MKRFISTIAIASAASFALADEGHLDITVYQSGGILYTGLIDEDTSIITPNVRVFEGDFQNIGGTIFADEPGIDILDGSFTPGAQLLLNIRKSLRVWNGSDFFSLAATDLTLEFGPQSLTTPAADGLTGPMIFDFDANGGLHDHPDFILNADITGIYLLEIEFAKDGFGTSLPAWIVFNYGLDEEDHELAVEWVERNLVPAPGSLLALSGLLALRRRRN
ncbi:MAG: hypothetical protein KF912_01355 [Phycisphaeraceae bacterium]|nr:hypothetical protein [Phycisphaeraceae bacterium]QYK48451.1 MAG: hypothetical protein KF838_01025 [Phycisphaeraceae bacterium]